MVFQCFTMFSTAALLPISHLNSDTLPNCKSACQAVALGMFDSIGLCPAVQVPKSVYLAPNGVSLDRYIVQPKCFGSIYTRILKLRRSVRYVRECWKAKECRVRNPLLTVPKSQPMILTMPHMSSTTVETKNPA